MKGNEREDYRRIFAGDWNSVGRPFAIRPLDDLMKPVDERKLAKATDWNLRTNFRPEQIALPVGGGFRKADRAELRRGGTVPPRLGLSEDHPAGGSDRLFF